MKPYQDRFQDVQDIIDKYFLANNASNIVKRKIAGLGAKASEVGGALSLGNRNNQSADETERRKLLRTLLFLLFTEAGQPTALAATFIERYKNERKERLLELIKLNLPLLEDSTERIFWDERSFSLVTNPPPANYRYMVFGMMNTYTGRGVSYEKIIANPNILQTFLLSTSIISPEHNSTYYPYGLILRVPKENIVSTSNKDQQFKNYKVEADDNTDNSMKHFIEMRDMRDEIRRVASGSVFTAPENVLKNTSGSGGMYGYNEIVVMGTAPNGSKVTIKGFFVKVDSKGKRWVREESKTDTPYVTDEIYSKLKGTGLPIVEIKDIKGRNK